MSDIPAGLDEWRRVLKPAGQLAFTTFTRNAFSFQAEMFKQAIEKFGMEFSEPGWQRLSSDSEYRELLEEAAYENVKIVTRQMGYHLSSEQDWWELVTNSGFRDFLEQLEPTQQAEFRVQHLEQVRTLCTGNGR